MPKKVSWDDKENIRFINCVGQQNKVRRHKKMSKSREDVYKQHIKELKTKMAEMVAEKDKKMAEMAEMVAQKDQEINDLADKVLELNLQLASSSRKSSDAMNTSTSSTGSSMSMASVSSSPSDK
jgi:3-methyladenine DNA glycosylase/8-oxoguanine DNA glycosylase